MRFPVPHNTEQLPVAVLEFKERRILVRTPENYRDAEVLARRKFGLGEIFDITFSSFNLGSSNGRRVEIDESAWQIVHPLLDEIIVTESQAVNAKRKSCHQMNNGHPAHIVSIKTEEEVGNVGRGGDYWQDDEVTPSVKNGASSDQESLWDDGFRFGEEDESCVEQSARRYDGDTTITEQRVGVVGAPGYASQQPMQNSSDEPRFLIEVTHAPSDQVSMFKTRAGHRVDKVLAGVCKFYNLDFEKSNLVLLGCPDGSFSGRRLLPLLDTMGNCGVISEARLVVEEYA